MSIDKDINIRVIFVGPENPTKPFRVIEDLLPYQDQGVKISLSHNSIGPIHGQTDIEHNLAIAGMAEAAIKAEKEGADAIVIESMGDSGLSACREAVSIPVVGLTDSTARVAQMLGRKFGLVTAGKWHGYALERLMRSYGIMHQYEGFEPLNMQPFFEGATSDEPIINAMQEAIDRLLERDVDTVLLGGSYFIGKAESFSKLQSQDKYKDLVIIDPLPLAIRFARMMVDAKLSQSKRIYAKPVNATPVLGYPGITTTPGA